MCFQGLQKTGVEIAMEIILEIILLLVGFVLLVKGADFFVDGSSTVAKKLRVPSIVIGLTIVAVGTSLPELAVSSLASFQNSNEIAFSNVIGSNLFNLLMVLGVSALLSTVPVKKSILKREFPFLTIITAVLVFLSGGQMLFSNKSKILTIFHFREAKNMSGKVSRVDGLILVLLFVFFLIWTVRYALKERQGKEENRQQELMSNGKCVFYIIGGAVAIIVGGELVVECAKRLALAAGMTETLVGLTVVALGTSLPELVTSAVAAKKGEADIAIGNVVGSNIANILLVLGLSAAISPVPVMTMSLADAVISLAVTVIVFVIAGTRKSIRKAEGVLMIFLYAGYMGYILARQYL